MTSLRQPVLGNMQLSGLSAKTQPAYVGLVYQLATTYLPPASAPDCRAKLDAAGTRAVRRQGVTRLAVFVLDRPSIRLGVWAG